MLMLAGHSYLGLNGDPRINGAAKRAIDAFGTGVAGMRLAEETQSLMRELEHSIANLKGAADAVAFSTGYLANITSIGCLLQQKDVIISDESNGTGLEDGCAASKAKHIRFKHNDAASLDRRLQECRTYSRKLVVAEAVFSMDGDILNLPAISRVCRRHGAVLLVDEAHAVGVLGRTGAGIEEHFGMPNDTIDIKTGTLSEVIPSSGGYVAGNNELCAYLRQEARGFKFAESPPPATLAAAIEGIQVLLESSQVVERLRKNSDRFKRLLREAGFELGQTRTPIVPILIGDSERAARLARYCQDRGVFIPVFVPPMIPAGTARLRATIVATHSTEDLEYAAKVLQSGARELGILPQPIRAYEAGEHETLRAGKPTRTGRRFHALCSSGRGERDLQCAG